MIFARQIAFVEDLEAQIFDALRRTLQEDGNIIVDFITQNQLFKDGEDGVGDKLLGYTRTTIRFKIEKGQPFDRTTLKDTGDFHASLTLDAGAKQMEISSNVPHARKLVKKYGRDILRPSLENMIEFFEVYYLPNLKKIIDGQLTG